MRHRSRAFLAAALAAGLACAAAVTATAGHAAAAGCQVTYTVTSQWSGGFTANVNLTNIGDPVTGWTMGWSFTAGQTVTQAWNAGVTQSGNAVTAVNAGWNGALATNGSTSFGFNGSWNGSANPTPASFTLNGVTCNGSTQPSTGPPTAAPTSSGPTSAPSTPPATPQPGTVRVYWLKPSDVPYDQRYPDGIADVMREAQRYYMQELGKTFELNDPVVEVVNGDHPRSWYENTPNGNSCYWWVVFNMQQELMRKLNLRAPDSCPDLVDSSRSKEHETFPPSSSRPGRCGG